MRIAHLGLPLIAALSLSGCVGVDVDGPLIDLPAETLAQTRIGTIFLSSNGTPMPDGYVGIDVPNLRQELERCARGPRPLVLRLDVEGGANRWRDVSVIAEFVDPAQDDLIVGRYFTRPRDPSLYRADDVLNDREMSFAEEVGYAVCTTVFHSAAAAPPRQD